MNLKKKINFSVWMNAKIGVSNIFVCENSEIKRFKRKKSMQATAIIWKNQNHDYAKVRKIAFLRLTLMMISAWEC